MRGDEMGDRGLQAGEVGVFDGADEFHDVADAVMFVDEAEEHHPQSRARIHPSASRLRSYRRCSSPPRDASTRHSSVSIRVGVPAFSHQLMRVRTACGWPMMVCSKRFQMNAHGSTSAESSASTQVSMICGMRDSLPLYGTNIQYLGVKVWAPTLTRAAHDRQRSQTHHLRRRSRGAEEPRSRGADTAERSASSTAARASIPSWVTYLCGCVRATLNSSATAPTRKRISRTAFHAQRTTISAKS